MTFYYYAVVPKYKVVVRLGHSHHDEEEFEQTREMFKNLDLDRLLTVNDWFLRYMAETKLKDIGELSLMNLTDITNYFADTSVLLTLVNEEMWTLAVITLFDEHIEKIIPETELEKYEKEGWIVIE